MLLQEEISKADDQQLRARMLVVGTDTPAWRGIVAELQWRATDEMIRHTKALDTL